MAGKDDDLSFEGAWKKQFKQEQEEPVKEVEEEATKSVKEVQEPTFRGQKDMVENRSAFIMPSKPKEEEKKEVEVVKTASSKEGDDFDVEW